MTPPYTHTPEFKLEHTALGRMMRLLEPTVVSFYESAGTAEELEAYYETTIVPWLNGEYANWLKRQPGKPYPMGIYLIGNILIVCTDPSNYQPWEDIPNLDKHLRKMDAQKFEWSQTETQERPAA